MSRIAAHERAQLIRDLRAWKKRPKRMRRLKPRPPLHGLEGYYSAILRREIQRWKAIVMHEVAPLLALLPKADHRFDESRPPALPVLFESTIARLRKQLRPQIDALSLTSLFTQVADHTLVGLNQQMSVVSSVPLFRGTTAAQQYLVEQAVTDNVSLIKTIPADMFGRIEAILKDGWKKEQRADVVTGRLQEAFGVAEYVANRIARTEVTKVSSQIVEARCGDMGIDTYEWSCSHDRRVRQRHLELDGQTFRFDNPPRATEDGQPPKYANPGQIWNCLPGDAEVAFPSTVYRAWRRWYTGELTSLSISGNVGILRTTPNHPILTNTGWKPAKDVQVGDYVFQVQEQITNTAGGKEAIQNRVVVADCYQAFIENGGELSRMAGATSQFHNDGIVDQEVYAVDVNHRLFQHVEAALSEQGRKLHLSFADSDSPVISAAGDRELELCVSGYNLPSTGGVGSSGDPSFCFGGGISEAVQVGVTAIAGGEPIALQEIHDAGAGHPQAFAHGEHGFTAMISADDRGAYLRPLLVSEISASAFDGWVYNFETHSGYYTSNSDIVVKNCRCNALPHVERALDKLLDD